MHLWIIKNIHANFHKEWSQGSQIVLEPCNPIRYIGKQKFHLFAPIHYLLQSIILLPTCTPMGFFSWDGLPWLGFSPKTIHNKHFLECFFEKSPKKEFCLDQKFSFSYGKMTQWTRWEKYEISKNLLNFWIQIALEVG